MHILRSAAQRLTGWERLRLCLSRRWRLRRCDAPSLGRRPKPFSLKPDIMQETRVGGRIKGEQSTGLENVLRTGSQLWLTPRRLRSRLNVKAHNLTHQLWPPKTLDCQKTRIARQQRKMGMLVLRHHQLAVLSRAPATLHLQRHQRSPLRAQHLSNHRLRLTQKCLQNCTWICTTLTRQPQRAAATC